MRAKLLQVVGAIGALAAVAGCRDTLTEAIDEGRAPFEAPSANGDQGLVVMLADPQVDAAAFAHDFISRNGGTLRFVFQHGTKGFSAILPAPAVRAIGSNPAVKFVEPIRWVDVVDHVTQTGAPWALDRIDQRARPLDGSYTYGEVGTGVTVYVFDTGILTTHSQFAGRAAVAFDLTGGNGQDCTGHGTHVAGIVGSSTYGVAKQVQLRAVRVIDCDPNTRDSTDTWMAGIDSIVGNHATPAVANMSLAVVDPATGRQTTDAAVDAKVPDLIAAGVPVVIAAGNDNVDACNTSPARVALAITVGASNSSDARWVDSGVSGSDFGVCLDLFAPGQSVTSAWWTSNTATMVETGTSMAAPHVAGTAALYLQRDPTATPSQVWSAISSRATSNALTNIGTGSPNRLLHSLFAEVSISGPSGISSCGTYTWTANPLGVQGSGWTYLWEAQYTRIGPQWYFMGSDQNLTFQQACPGTGSFTLRVTATGSLGFHGTAVKFVFNGF